MVTSNHRESNDLGQPGGLPQFLPQAYGFVCSWCLCAFVLRLADFFTASLRGGLSYVAPSDLSYAANFGYGTQSVAFRKLRDLFGRGSGGQFDASCITHGFKTVP
jgi:hypothetical protein